MGTLWPVAAAAKPGWSDQGSGRNQEKNRRSHPDSMGLGFQGGVCRMEGSKRLRILLVEDHETDRAALKLLIDREADLQVVEELSNGSEVIRRNGFDDLDVVVMDLSMPGVSGAIATRKLKELRPDLPVVSLTRHADQTFLEELLRAGVSAYVLKQSPHSELLRAIRAAAAGQQYIDSALTHHLAAPFAAQGRRRTGRASPGLTERETEVLRFVSQGH